MFLTLRKSSVQLANTRNITVIMSSLLKRWHHQLQMLTCLMPYQNSDMYCIRGVDKNKKMNGACSCISISKIPFILSSSLVEVLNLPTITRFNITENVATLAPDLSTNCSAWLCAEAVQQFERQSKIILTNSVISAKGMYLLL